MAAPLLKGDGWFSGTGTVCTDAFRNSVGAEVQPSPGMRLIGIALDSVSNTGLGSITSSDGWEVVSHGTTLVEGEPVPNEARAVSSGAAITVFEKECDGTDPASTVYTAVGGGVHTFQVFAFPQGCVIDIVPSIHTQGSTSSRLVSLGPVDSTRPNAYAITAVVPNGNMTSPAVDNGFEIIEANTRGLVATKALPNVGSVSVSWTLPSTSTARVMSGVLIVVQEAAPPSGGGMFLVSKTGQRLAARWRTAAYEEPPPPSGKVRVLVDTDLGGDPDDTQSLVHALHYSDILGFEGFVSGRGVTASGDPEQIRKWIRHTDLNYLRSKGRTALISENEALALVKTGARSMGGPATGRDTEGSNWIVQRARAGSANDPLWVLCWGAVTDLAQALFDAPDIVDKIRVYSIGDHNTGSNSSRGDLLSHAWLTDFAHANDLWWIENGVLPVGSRSTFFGVWLGGNQAGKYHRSEWIPQVVRGKGTTSNGRFPTKLGDAIPLANGPAQAVDALKEGDSPSFLYLISPVVGGVGNLDDPTSPSWGGQFQVINSSYPHHWGDLKSSATAAQATISQWRTQFLDSWEERWGWYGTTTDGPGPEQPVDVTATDREVKLATGVYTTNALDATERFRQFEQNKMGRQLKFQHHGFENTTVAKFKGNVDGYFGEAYKSGNLFQQTRITPCLLVIAGFKAEYPGGEEGKAWYNKADRFAHWAKWTNGDYDHVINYMCDKIIAAGHLTPRISFAHESDIPKKVDSYTDLTVAEIKQHFVPMLRRIFALYKARIPGVVREWRNNGGVMNKLAADTSKYHYEVVLNEIKDVVEQVSCSAYYHATEASPAGNWDVGTRPVKSRLNFTWSMAQKYNKSMSIYEWGMSSQLVNTSLDHPHFIQGMYDWLREHKVDNHVYFYNHYGSNLDKYPLAGAKYYELFGGPLPPITTEDDPVTPPLPDPEPDPDDPPPVTGGRNAFDVPFESNAWPNLPLSDAATFTVDAATTSLRAAGGYWNQQNGWSYVLRQATTLDPYADIVDTGDGNGSRKGYVPANMPIPAGTGPGGYDRPCIVLQPDGTWITMYGANKISDTRWECFRVEDVPPTSDGITPGGSIGSRADGLADAWGIVRKYDWQIGRIPHMLAIAPPPARMLNGKVWPAVDYDSGGYPPGGAITMGQVFAVPNGVTKPGNLSAAGEILWQQVKHFGWQVRDEGGTENTVFYAEQVDGTADAAFVSWVNSLNAEVAKILPYVQRVTNVNSEAGYAQWRTGNKGKGGGNLLVPLLPPITTTVEPEPEVPPPVVEGTLLRVTFDGMTQNEVTDITTPITRRNGAINPPYPIVTLVSGETIDGPTMKVTKDLTTTTGFDAWATKPRAIPVIAGNTYTARANMRMPDGMRQANLFIEWFTAADAPISATSGPVTNVPTTGTAAVRVTGAVAPAGAAWAQLVCRISSMSGETRLLVDNISFIAGSDTGFPAA